MNELFVAGGFSTTRYQAELLKLQLELCHVQEWAALSRERAIVALEGRSGAGKGRIRRTMIVALARKLMVALWRYVTQGLVPEGAVIKG